MLNPAIALYDYWDSILTLLDTRTTAYGTKGYGLERYKDDIIDWGDIVHHGWHRARFRIASDGRFQFTTNFRRGWCEPGWPLRLEVAKAITFLHVGTSGPSNQDYAWSACHEACAQGWRGLDLNRHDTPHPYIIERPMLISSSGSIWMRLAKDAEHGWRIEPADDDTYIRAGWEHAIRLREYRYMRLANEDAYHRGLKVRPGQYEVSEPHLRVGSDVLEGDDVIAHLAAWFDIDQPLHTEATEEASKESHARH